MAGHTALCIICMTRDPEAFDSDDLLICIECSANHEHCVECAEPYDFTLSGLEGLCDACLDAAERATRLRRAA
ncbi:MAG: hypothetical protein ACJ740_09405 [Gaiellales bacterium]|jgi:hypothetical protein|nr:hypothetical protein [Gaiellales bacterium]